MLKRRTREHVIADLSVNHVERFILRCGWTVERVTHDYGLDQMMKTYSPHGEPESGHVSFQLKATDAPQIRKKKNAFAVRLDSRDVMAWLNEPMPVILILYDAVKDRSFWVDIKAYFAVERGQNRSRVGATVTIYIPVAHEVTEETVRRFSELRKKVMTKFWGMKIYEE